jgi:hypothetical protein
MEKPTLFDLKKKLIIEDDFGKMYEFFMDHFGENDAFLALGKRVQPADFPITNVAVAAALATIAATPSAQKAKSAARVQPIHLPEEHFLHGPIHLGNTFGVFFYFEDVDVGLVYVYAGGDLSTFARISVRPESKRSPLED